MAASALERKQLERGIYRCRNFAKGFITYFAVTAMGDVLNDEYRSVRPGTVSESRVVTELGACLDASDGHITPAVAPSSRRLSLGPQLVR